MKIFAIGMVALAMLFVYLAKRAEEGSKGIIKFYKPYFFKESDGPAFGKAIAKGFRIAAICMAVSGVIAFFGGDDVFSTAVGLFLAGEVAFLLIVASAKKNFSDPENDDSEKFY